MHVCSPLGCLVVASAAVGVAGVVGGSAGLFVLLVGWHELMGFVTGDVSGVVVVSTHSVGLQVFITQRIL